MLLVFVLLELRISIIIIITDIGTLITILILPSFYHCLIVLLYYSYYHYYHYYYCLISALLLLLLVLSFLMFLLLLFYSCSMTFLLHRSTMIFSGGGLGRAGPGPPWGAPAQSRPAEGTARSPPRRAR